MDRHDKTKRLVTAWVNREQLELLVKNGVNISEVIRKALKAELKKIGLVTLLIFMSACSKAEYDAVGIVDLGPVRNVQAVWIDNVTGEKLNLTDVQTYNDSYATFITPHVQCSSTVYFKGDNRTGPVRMNLPQIDIVVPPTGDTAPCEFIKTITGYSIVGQQLTIRYNQDQNSRTFMWSSAQ